MKFNCYGIDMTAVSVVNNGNKGVMCYFTESDRDGFIDKAYFSKYEAMPETEEEAEAMWMDQDEGDWKLVYCKAHMNIRAKANDAIEFYYFVMRDVKPQVQVKGGKQ